MSSGQIIKTGTFDKWEQIPKEGDIIIDGNVEYIVNSLSLIEEREYYSGTFNLTQNHAIKREYMEADTNLVLSKIPTEDIIDTYFLDTQIINLSIDTPLNSQLNYGNFKRNYISNFIIPQNNLKDLILWSNFNNTGISMDFLFNDIPLAFVGGPNIFFTISPLNNFIWKMEIDNKGNLTPSYYANDLGVTQQATYELADKDLNVWYANTLSGNPIKDKYEILHYTLQINYNGVNDTIVTENYTNCVLNGITNDLKVLLYGVKHNANEPIDITYGVDVGNVSASIDTTNQIIKINIDEQEIGHQSLIILLDNKPILVKNYKEWQQTIKGFNIYYSVENGYPTQTGVRPYRLEERS